VIGGPGHFTAEWLEAALGPAAGAIDDVVVRPVGTGQVAATYRIHISGRDYRGPGSLIAKGPSEDAASRRAGIVHGLYRRELDWYERFAIHADIRCPRHIHSEYSAGDEGFALLLEDCSPARQGDQLRGAPIADIAGALREAVQLHGAFLRDPAAMGELRTPVEAQVLQSRIDIFRRSWPRFRERYEGILDAELLGVGDRLAERYEHYVLHTPAVLSVVHRDFRVDNMLFGRPDERVVALDWQTFGPGHPMLDVAYLIGTSVEDPGERARHERALVDDYCARLAAIAPDTDLGGFWDEYRLQAFWGFVMAVTSSVQVARTARGDEMFGVMARRPARQVLDLDSLALLG